MEEQTAGTAGTAETAETAETAASAGTAGSAVAEKERSVCDVESTLRRSVQPTTHNPQPTTHDLIVSRRAVHSRHGNAEQPIVDAELAAVVDQVAHHQDAQQRVPRSFDEDLRASSHCP